MSSTEFWTPAEITTNLWLDAKDSSTISVRNDGSDDYVTQWNDKSGNGNHMAQSTASNQPKYTGTTTKGVEFDGTDDALIHSYAASLNPATLSVFVVIDVDDSASGYRSPITSRGDNDGNGTVDAGWNIYKHNNYYESWTRVGNKWYTDTWSQTTTDKVMLGWTESATRTMYFNGTQTDSQSSKMTQNTVGPCYVGAGATEAYPPQYFFFKGLIHEIILVSGVVSTDTRQRIEGYLAWKWGLDSQLPSGHPYEDNPPYECSSSST
jgi:hypothetical protein